MYFVKLSSKQYIKLSSNEPDQLLSIAFSIRLISTDKQEDLSTMHQLGQKMEGTKVGGKSMGYRYVHINVCVSESSQLQLKALTTPARTLKLPFYSMCRTLMIFPYESEPLLKAGTLSTQLLQSVNVWKSFGEEQRIFTYILQVFAASVGPVIVAVYE
ncbi:hypothetical protein TNCV_4224641 [Trichonephila clavipes]|nr:hypothetical protein TNCV_3335921 [Trichonephila clavipes]GFU92010.1 hypothetical protein TNCV_4224641 [Trichonephila clavipes]